MSELSLRRMTISEFETFRTQSIRGYAAEQVLCGNWTEDEAETRSQGELDKLLADGVDTPGMLVLMAENANGNTVGHVWVSLQLPDSSAPGAWIYYIQVDPEHRGKGYGRALLQATEQEVSKYGLNKIGLNVLGANKVARSLYESSNFEMTRMQMFKEL